MRGLCSTSHGELVHVGLTDHNCTCFFQVQHCFCRVGRFEVVQNPGTTGGQSIHTLTLSEIPSHNHAIYSGWSENSPGRDAYRYQYWGANDLSWKENPNLSTGYRGGDGAHNNMPPYFAVYMWRRTK